MATRAKTTQAAPRRATIVQAPSTLPPHDPPAGRSADIGGGFDPAPSPVIAGDQDNLMDLLNGFADADSVNVKVYRVIKNKPLAYMFECSPESFSMDELRDKYRGGEFRVYIHRDGELVRNVRVVIEPPPQAPQEPKAGIEAALSDLMDRQSKTDKLLEAMVTRMAAQPAAPSLGSILSGIDLPATITAVGALVNMLRPPAPPPMPTPAPVDATAGIDLIMKGIELARELKGDSGGESSLMDVVRDLIKSPMLASAITAASSAAQQPQPMPQQRPALPPGRAPGRVVNTPMGPVHQPQPQPQPQHQQAAQHQPQPEPGAEVSHAKPGDSEAPELLGYLAQLTQLASQDADPALYAGLILDQLGDDVITPMLDWLPDPVSHIIALHPPAGAYRAWFEQLVGHVAAAYDDDGSGEDDGAELPNGGVVDVDAQVVQSGDAHP